MPIVNAGQLNTTALIVPDLFVQIQPPSTLALNGVPSNMVALVGTAAWGPLNTPQSFASMGEYSYKYGSIQNRKYDMGTHAGIITQNGGNNMLGVRVSDSTDTAATAVVGSTNITFTGKYTGTQGNNITVTVQNGAKTSTWRAIVSISGFTPEVFDNIGFTHPAVNSALHPAISATATMVVASTVGIVPGMTISGTGISGSPTVLSITNSTTLVASAVQTVSDNTVLTFTPSNNEIWVNMASAINNGQNIQRGASAWIVATAGSGVTAPTLTAFPLSGGTDGITTITASVLVGSSSTNTGMYALAGSGFAMLDLCDADDTTEFVTIDAFANQESGYAIHTLPAGTTVAGAVTAKRSAGLDSYNSKLMHGDWIFWNDPVNQVTRLVSPQAFAAGRLSNLSPEQTTLNKVIVGVAGTQKSGLGSISAYYSTADLTTLALSGIDVITNPGGGQLAIWTCRFGHNTSTNITVHLDSYTTLTNYVSKTLEAGLGFYLGRTISNQLFNDITATLNNFLSRLAGNGLLLSPDGRQPYFVLCSTVNNPPNQTTLGIVTADVQAQYPSINEKFIVNLQGGNTVSVTRVTSN